MTIIWPVLVPTWISAYWRLCRELSWVRDPNSVLQESRTNFLGY